MNARPLPCEGSALPLSYSPIKKLREKWSGKRDSNPRPTAWKAIALPAELFPPATADIIPSRYECVKKNNTVGTAGSHRLLNAELMR